MTSGCRYPVSAEEVWGTDDGWLQYSGVEEVSESENGVFCKTRLIGPSEGNQGGEPSYPCIVLKIKKTGKPVQFTG